MISRQKYPEYLLKLRTQQEFEQLSEEEFTDLTADVKFRLYPKGQILFDQDDQRNHFYYLLNGIVRVERFDVNGDANFYEYISMNHGFPYRGLFVADTYAYSVRSMTEILVADLPMGKFEAKIKSNLAMMQNIVIKMEAIISQDEDHLQHMITSSASERVAYSILLMGVKLGTLDENEHLKIDYPVNINELAEVSATTRETASKVVSKLQRNGYLTYSHKRFTFLKCIDENNLSVINKS
ncbi:Crp/Fnr family transcriptional regulator [Lentilactobacillus senioris]|uniref:Crp/Fnr family transcriptional regulator n=1 Tax=Lentilactobacillus senioris TaxID=931534 RepID=UPI00227F763A|nr:Crp/Fnr family transcriptional regulator [Lentilactobacillus senioris]MCY9806412.1 Crp/Fnr family transcriptional regulator [Lentilactobacillus senioris]